MQKRLIPQQVDLANPKLEIVYFDGTLGDVNAHTWRVEVIYGGVPVDLTGATVTANFVRSDKVTVLIEGSVYGNVATVDVVQECCAAVGAVRGSLVVMRDGAKITEALCEGMITRRSTDVIVTPGTPIPDPSEVIAMVNDVNAGEAARVAAEVIRQFAIVEKTGYGVVSGLGVTAQTTPNMSVKIAAGIAYVSTGTRYTPAAVASQTINAAHSTLPRIDIIYLSSTGTVSYLAGTAAATPSAPATPAGGLLLAEISVAAGATAIQAANITARKKGIWTDDIITPTLINGWSASGALGTPKYFKDVLGFVTITGGVGPAQASSIIFYLAPGHWPASPIYFPVISNGGLSTVLVNTNGAVSTSNGGSAWTGFPSLRFKV